MHKIVPSVLGALALSVVAAWPAHADWSGPDDGSGYWGPAFCSTQPADFTGICTAIPESFSVTLVQFRLRKLSDKSFVNLATSPQTFDFASSTAGAALGNFASGASVPADTYDALGFVAEGGLVIRGEATLNEGSGPRCRTTSSGVAMGTGAAVNYTASMNNTPLFDVIGSGTDAVEGAADGPGLEINYINPDEQMVFIGDSIEGTSFPLTVTNDQTLTFDFSMRPVKGIVFEWVDGTCVAAYGGDMQIRISSSVE